MYYPGRGFAEDRVFGREVDVVRGVNEVVGEAEGGAGVLEGGDEGVRQGRGLSAARGAGEYLEALAAEGAGALRGFVDAACDRDVTSELHSCSNIPK